MPREPDTRSREQRLAAKLRENLHRRKAQARAQQQQDTGEQSMPGGRSKSPPKS